MILLCETDWPLPDWCAGDDYPFEVTDAPDYEGAMADGVVLEDDEE